MSTSITTSFITSYEAKVHEVFQRRGSHLLNAVRHRSDVVGNTASFNKIGTGTATTKARHGVVTPMNQTHTAPTCTLVDFYAGDWVDKLDEAKTNIAERDAIASGGAMALGRKIDSQIITVLDSTTESTITLTTTGSSATFQGTILQWVEAAWENDVPNDGNVYAIVTSRCYSQLMTITSFGSADFVGFDGMPFKEGVTVGIGKWKNWMGVKWTMFTGLPGNGGATASQFLWHNASVAYASAAAAGNVAGNAGVAAEITYSGERVAHFVNHLMSGEACLIDTTGVIQSTTDDTQSVITS